MKLFKNKKGQGLVEYLLLVALMAVASIAVLKVLQKTMNVQYANIIKSLQGEDGGKVQHERVRESHYKKKDLNDFMQGAVNKGGSE